VGIRFKVEYNPPSIDISSSNRAKTFGMQMVLMVKDRIEV